ncbi:Protein-S-isoprenylcysteine O-methyltransferase Ste14 [Cyclonatronum proteinivorum]|uniref:Protein-S-isoprenylcysteine O-methyltransferase Ste14 n=1 Tax=Cyclonatronum proteinivorum TaxID=1457365 RepID=A0A345UMA0_9BACT|nr:isoprenylcysteine carboxylmethyltransferase family protein [Cyclonatronum proteinivorum]AXJ01602.1 Protein-S-isoprenylcysteine O-methyltransferase Ste14 [Cyclonatronum proteinivorum]
MIFVLAFLGFAILHSILASRVVKRNIIGIFPQMRWYYRLLYNVIAVLTLAVVWFAAPVESHMLYKVEPPLQFGLHLIQIGALAGLWVSVRHAGTSSFLGLRQLRDARQGIADYDLDEPATGQLVVRGPFRYVRHPLYVFSIVILVAHPVMTLKWALFTFCCVIYFVAGSWFEERRLLARYGRTYEDYRKRVPAFIPYKRYQYTSDG